MFQNALKKSLVEFIQNDVDNTLILNLKKINSKCMKLLYNHYETIN